MKSRNKIEDFDDDVLVGNDGKENIPYPRILVSRLEDNDKDDGGGHEIG